LQKSLTESAELIERTSQGSSNAPPQNQEKVLKIIEEYSKQVETKTKEIDNLSVKLKDRKLKHDDVKKKNTDLEQKLRNMDSKLNECNKFSLFFIKNVKSHNNTLKE